MTVENVAELATIGFTGGDGVGSDSDFTVEPEAELIEGDDDTVTIALNDAEGNDLTIEDGGEGFENINIALEGDNVLNSITSQDSQSVTITGTGSLDLDDEIAGVDAVDASSASGDISMVMANEDVTVTTGSGDDEIEFGTGEFTDDDTVNLGDGDDTVAVTLNSSVNQPADVTNTEILSIQGDDDGNAENFTFDIGGFDPLTTVRFESQGTTVTADTILIDDAEFGFGVEYRGDGNDANQSFDNFTFDFTGAGGSDDTLAISFNNQGEDLDDNSRTVTANTLDIDDIENLEISLGDGGVVTLAAINGQEVEGVTVDNPGDEVFTITAALESTEVSFGRIEPLQPDGFPKIHPPACCERIVTSARRPRSVGGSGVGAATRKQKRFRPPGRCSTSTNLQKKGFDHEGDDHVSNAGVHRAGLRRVCVIGLRPAESDVGGGTGRQRLRGPVPRGD
jgi:hypothetical protein